MVKILLKNIEVNPLHVFKNKDSILDSKKCIRNADFVSFRYFTASFLLARTFYIFRIVSLNFLMYAQNFKRRLINVSLPNGKSSNYKLFEKYFFV